MVANFTHRHSRMEAAIGLILDRLDAIDQRLCRLEGR
jgi:hypothetical protein